MKWFDTTIKSAWFNGMQSEIWCFLSHQLVNSDNYYNYKAWNGWNVRQNSNISKHFLSDSSLKSWVTLHRHGACT